MKMQSGSQEERLSICTYETSRGFGAVVAGPAGLKEVVLPSEYDSRERLMTALEKRFPGCGDGGPGSPAGEGASLLARYFRGEPVEFSSLLIDYGCFTPFQREVYRFVAAIPYGTVVTYRDVAAGIGRPRAPRGIGSAMGRNPLPIIIPCHRVVGCSGAMTGYSAPGGTALKQWLLQLEGIRLTSRGRVEREQLTDVPRIS